MKAPIIMTALCALALFYSSQNPAQAQVDDAPDGMIANIPVNYTEARAGNYVLPDVLKMFDGTPVTDAKMWTEKRRPELLKYYQTQIYGQIPATAPKVSWEIVNTDPQALNGKAVMRTLAGHMGGPGGPLFNVTIYTPAGATRPVPILLAINFNFGAARGAGRVGGRAPATGPAVAGAAAGRAPRGGPGFAAGPQRGTPAELIDNGFGYATVYHTSIETDTDGQPNINIARKLGLAPGQTAPAADEWGSIAAWAWGLSRIVDYLETDSSVDAKRIAIMGVSRLGKTVLWEGANDPRIALVIASCSGNGGASLARRTYGETIAHLVAPTRYPYQFAGNYANYAKDPNTLLVDTHCLVALMAPRPLLLQTGNTDRWSDPKGEFLAAVAATPVFQLLGASGIDTGQMPGASQFVGNTLGFYMHAGPHGTIPSDWDIYLKFMKDNLHPGS
jgi:hypothetical protein